MITNTQDLLELMNWQQTKDKKGIQKKLLIELSEEEKIIADILQGKDNVHSDELLLKSGFKYPQLASVLLQLEMQGHIKSLPGKIYRLN